MARFWKFSVALAALVLVVWGAVFVTNQASGDSGYELKLMSPNAANLAEGSPVQVRGVEVGTVSSFEVLGDKALVTIGISGDRAPLHTGTRARVVWKSLVGERVVEVLPGPERNPTIPSGGVIEVGSEQVRVDQVLSALDAPTRAHLASTVRQLDRTLTPHSADLNQTLKQAGPAVGALGDVLKAVGQDGPAIRSLVTNLKKVTEPLAARQQQLQETVGDVTDMTGAVAPKEAQLRETLKQLPSTLNAAKKTLDRVPGAVDQTAPVLDDLRPATRQLTSVSKNLSPLLVDLRPTMAELRPTLGSASSLLKKTPAMLDSAQAVVPSLTDTVKQLNPAVDFLRPYTPSLAGWLSNWGNAFSGYDSRGHIFHGLVQAGTNSLDDNPGVPVGLSVDEEPAPGDAGGQPWTDANGSGMR